MNYLKVKINDVCNVISGESEKYVGEREQANKVNGARVQVFFVIIIVTFFTVPF